MPNRFPSFHSYSANTACLVLAGNIAFNKPTNQSGIDIGTSSGKAVDGHKDRAGSNYCTSVQNTAGKKAWFYVDLAGLHRIYNVTVYNTYNGKPTLHLILLTYTRIPLIFRTIQHFQLVHFMKSRIKQLGEYCNRHVDMPIDGMLH